jgi:gephyrin
MTSSAYPMVGMTQALESISTIASELLSSLIDETETLSSTDPQLLGRALVEPVVSPINVPSFRASIMDGYAVHAKHTQQSGTVTLTVVGSMLAGDDPSQIALHGDEQNAVYVTTGGPVPDGADAVVKIEQTNKVETKSGGVIEVSGSVKPGQWIREIGSDVKEGEVVIEAGSVIGPAEVGLLVMLGVSGVKVRKKVRVGVISTGSELVEFASSDDSKSGGQASAKNGKIFDSNRIMLISALKNMEGSSGVEIVDFGIVKDSVGELENALDSALEKVDVMVSTGGVSMGAADLVKPYLERKGRVIFGRLLMKPGKPATFAVVNSSKKTTPTLFFALPGNPVSAMVCFYLLVHPAVMRLQNSKTELPKIEVVLSQDITLDPERPE